MESEGRAAERLAEQDELLERLRDKSEEFSEEELFSFYELHG